MRSAIGGTAAAGVVVAHELAYRFTLPDAHHRAEVLDATGHGYWHWLIALTLGAAVAGLCRIARGREPEPLLTRTVLRLCLIQVAAFLVLESSERMLTGSHGGSLLREPAVQLGLVLQVAAAVIGAVALKLFTRVVALLRTTSRSLSEGRVLAIPLPAARVLVRTRPAAVPAAPRGPPVGVL